MSRISRFWASHALFLRISKLLKLPYDSSDCTCIFFTASLPVLTANCFFLQTGKGTLKRIKNNIKTKGLTTSSNSIEELDKTVEVADRLSPWYGNFDLQACLHDVIIIVCFFKMSFLRIFRCCETVNKLKYKRSKRSTILFEFSWKYYKDKITNNDTSGS